MPNANALAILAGINPKNRNRASAPTNLHVLSGEVCSKSEDGIARVLLDGLVFSEDDSQWVEIDSLGGLEEGDIATILLSGEEGKGMTPFALGTVGGIDRLDVRIASIEADYIKAEVLDAQIARIDTLEADTADIVELVAEKASISDLNAATARIDDLEAADVTITGRLTAAEGDIDDLEAEDARISNLVATKADISDLNAATARIGNLEAADVTITGRLSTAEGNITNLTSSKADISDLNAATARIGDLEAADVTITGRLTAAEGDIDDLEAEDARINNLVATKASVSDLNAATARIGVLEADHVTVADFEAEQANIDTLQANTADIATIRVNSAKVANLTAAELEADHATIGSLDTNFAHADMANVSNAWIENGTVKEGAITNAMINSVSANKLTAGTIDASNITVTNLNASNITTGTINGQRIGEGSLSLSKLEEDVYTETEVDNLLETMQAEIDGAIETWTGTVIPTLQNAPAVNWTSTLDKDKHVGDVYFVVNSQSQQNGYNYRFTKTGSTYSWQLIKDTDITNALQRLTTAEGKITTFDSDISQLKTDTGTLTTKTTSLETSLGDKADITTVNEISDTVDEHTQSITQLSTKTTTALNRGVEYINGTQTATTGNWTGVTTDSALYTGKTIAYRLPYAGSGNASLQLKDSNGNNVGGNIAVYMNNTRVNTHYPANTVIKMTYDGTYWRTDNYDSNNYDRERYSASVTASAAIAAGRIGVFGTDGKLKLLAASAFDLTRPILYVNTAYTDSALTQTNNYIYFGAPFALTNTHAITGAAAGKAVYIVGTISNNVMTPTSTVLTCTEPTSADGYFYLRLGTMATSANAILESNHPLYTYIDGKFQQATPQVVTTVNKVSEHTQTIDGIQTRVGSLETTVESKADSSTVTTIGNNLSTLEQNVEGFKTTVSSTYATKTELGNAVDDISIGGRNLLRYRVYNYADASSVIGVNSAYRGMYCAVDGGEIYTVSRRVIEGNRFWIDWSEQEPAAGVALHSLSKNNTALKVTVDVPSEANWLFIYLSNQSDVISDGNIKVERGNKATDWTPAPEDMATGSDLTALTTRVSTAESTIEQHDASIALKANSADVYTKQQSDGLISTEVTNRNAAISAATDAINLSVSQTYTTKTEFNNTVSVRFSMNRGQWTDAQWVTCEAVGYVSNWSNAHVDANSTLSATGFDSTTLRVGDLIAVNGISKDTQTPHAITIKVNVVPSSASATINATTVESHASTGLATKIDLNPSLTPFFSVHNDDGTYPVGDADGYWQPSSNKMYSREYFTALDDGWAHLEACNSNQKEFVPPRVESLNAGDKVTMMVEWRNAVVTGNGPNFYTRNYSQEVQLNANWYFLVTDSPESGVSYHVFTVNSTAIGEAEWNGLVNVTFTSKASSTWTGDIRISFYKGVYNGPYKPYSGELLYATQSNLESVRAEIKVTTDGITSEVEKKTDKASIISTINQSAETVKIQASKVEIDGTAIFSAISSDVDDAIADATGPFYQGRENSTGYIHLGHVPYAVGSTSNYSHFHLTGRIGGWQSTNSGNIDVTFKSRSDNDTYNTVDRKDDAIDTTKVDVLVYTGTDTYTHYWLKVSGYWYAQLYADYEQLTEDDHTRTATEPTGTCVWKLSEQISVAAADATEKANAAEANALNRITSRGEQLVTNGNGFMGDNTNFSSLVFDGSESNGSPGSFTKNPSTYSVITSNEMFPVDMSKQYAVEFDVKCEEPGAQLYSMLTFYDVDKNNISVQMVSYFPDSTTTLARELKNGDTVIYLTSAAGWNDTTYGHQRSVIIWDYTNSFGYTYPPGTYSRNFYMDIYESNASVDKTNHTITLKSAWTGGTHAAGTSISQNSSGANYAYFWYHTNIETFPREWTHVSATYTGVPVPTSSQPVVPNIKPLGFWAGTAYCKIGFLWNYRTGAQASQEQGHIWVTNISVKENKASATDAVSRTQRIYYRATAANMLTGPTTWLATSGTGYGNWSLKVPQLTSGTTKYPYLYTCVQTQTVSQQMQGTDCTCSAVLLDDTTTIIDGGTIITGTVNANAINASSGTFDTANIPNLSASKITSGTIDAARIDASQLTIGVSNLATQADVDSIEVGGRNLLTGTGDWSGSNIGSSAGSVSGDTFTFSTHSSLGWYAVTLSFPHIPFADVDGQTLTLGFDYRSDDFSDTSGDHYIWINAAASDTVTGGRTKYRQISTSAFNGVFVPTTEWQRGSITFDMSEAFLNAGSGECNYVYIQFFNHTLNSLQLRHVKLERGNKTTDWTPAPEDQTAYVDTSIDNISIGSKNLLLGTKDWSGTNGGASIVISSELYDSAYIASCTYTTTSSYLDFRAWNNSIIPQSDTYYTLSFWAKASTDNAEINSYFYRSNDGTVESGYNSSGNTTTSSDGGIVNRITTEWQRVWITWKTKANLSSNARSIIVARMFKSKMDGETIYLAGVKFEKGNRATDWSPAPEDTEASIATKLDASNNRIWYAECSTVAATTAKVATIVPATTEFTLVKGQTVNVWFSTQNSGAVASLTLSVNGTAAKGIRYLSNGVVTTLPNANYLRANQVVPFVYDGNYWVADFSYNSDTYNRTRWQGAIKILAKPTGTWRLLCGTASGYCQIAAGVAFDLSYPILAVSAQPEANTTTDTGYNAVNALTFSNTAAIQSGVENKTIYLKGSVTGNTFTIDSSNVFTTVVPSSEDGCAYIPLGIMTSATVGYFKSSKELYAYKDGAFGPVSIREASAAAKTATNYIHADSTGIRIANADPATATTYQHQTATSTEFVVDDESTLEIGNSEIRVGSTSGMFQRVTPTGLEVYRSITESPLFSVDAQASSDTSVSYESLARLGGTESFVGMGGGQASQMSITEMPAGITHVRVIVEFYATRSDYVSAAYSNSFIVEVGASATALVDFSNTDAYGNVVIMESCTLSTGTLTVNISLTSDDTRSSTISYTYVIKQVEALKQVTSITYYPSMDVGTHVGDAGRYSVGFGKSVRHSGNYSFAQGWNAKATGNYSRSNGYFTEASGNYSQADGLYAEASDDCAHAEGYHSKAQGYASHAQNYYTIAASDHQTVIGRENVEDANDTYALIIGNGDVVDGVMTRSNALTVDWNGNVDAAGEVTQAVSSTTCSAGTAAGTIGVNHVERVGNVVTVTLGNAKLAASLSAGSITGTYATVPVGYRPSHNVYFAFGVYNQNGTFGYARIETSGAITLRNTSTSAIGTSAQVAFTGTYIIN